MFTLENNNMSQTKNKQTNKLLKNERDNLYD